MGVTLTQLKNKADGHIKYTDLVNLTVTERETACREAAQEYSRIRPLYVLQAYTGVGGDAPFYSLPTSWDEGFSVILEIEYPINQVPKRVIEQRYWQIDLRPDGKQIRFGAYNPPTGSTFWVKYTAKHEFDSAGNSNIDDADLTGLSFLAASLLCDKLATFYASKADGNLPNVEIVEFKSRMEEYSAKARNWMKKYLGEIKADLTGTWESIPFVDSSYWDRTNQ